MRFTTTDNRHLKRVRDFDTEPVRKLSRFKRGSNQFIKVRKDAGVSRYTVKHAWNFAGYVMLVGYVAILVSSYLPGQYVSPLPTGKQSAIKVYAAEVTPVPTYADPIGDELKEFIRKTRILESGNGTNTNPNALHNICASRNQWNRSGYGGMQGIDGELYCFRDADHEYTRLAVWYREKRQTYTEAQTYCGYVHGFEVVQDTCQRWEAARGL